MDGVSGPCAMKGKLLKMETQANLECCDHRSGAMAMFCFVSVTSTIRIRKGPPAPARVRLRSCICVPMTHAFFAVVFHLQQDAMLHQLGPSALQLRCRHMCEREILLKFLVQVFFSLEVSCCLKSKASFFAACPLLLQHSIVMGAHLQRIAYIENSAGPHSTKHVTTGLKNAGLNQKAAADCVDSPTYIRASRVSQSLYVCIVCLHFVANTRGTSSTNQQSARQTRTLLVQIPLRRNTMLAEHHHCWLRSCERHIQKSKDRLICQPRVPTFMNGGGVQQYESPSFAAKNPQTKQLPVALLNWNLGAMLRFCLVISRTPLLAHGSRHAGTLTRPKCVQRAPT